MHRYLRKVLLDDEMSLLMMLDSLVDKTLAIMQ